MLSYRRHLRLASAFCALLWITIAGCDRDSGNANIGKDKPNLAAEFEQMQAQATEEEEKLFEKFDAAFEKAEAEGDSAPAFDMGAIDKLHKKYLLRLQEFATKAKGAEIEPQVWMEIFSVASMSGEAGTADRAMSKLINRFIDSPQLEDAASLAARTAFFGDPAPAEKALQTMIDKSPHDNVKAAAKLALASVLLMGGEGASEADQARAEKLLVSIEKDHADTEYAEGAKAYLFEMRNLQVGKPVPDIEDTGIDGTPIKLSSYQGQVVVLDFWGFW